MPLCLPILLTLAAAPLERVVIDLDLPAPEDSAGGIAVGNLTDDPGMELIVTVPGQLQAVTSDGRKLWHRQADLVVGSSSETFGLPGHHGSGVTCADLDGDGRDEVIFVTRDGLLHIAEGATGEDRRTARPPVPDGAERWEQVIPAALRAPDSADLILQATNADGYRMGRYLAAYAADRLDGPPLWTTSDYLGCAHNGARVADLDGDGRDEVLGGTILSPDGVTLFRLDQLRGHLDSIFCADVVPERPGLEVIALEEGGPQRVFCYDEKGLIWETHHRNQEPQNAALGRFADVAGLVVWCRSRYNEHQLPWTFDQTGALLAEYVMDEVAPEGWTASGVETIFTIDWTGDERQLACAKERHTEGKVCLFEPVSGRFVEVIDEQAARLMVADVSGDPREEILVLNGNSLRIYTNPAPNPRPDTPRLWTRREYLRAKQSWNYYSP